MSFFMYGDQLDVHAYVGKKTLVFLIHAHFAVTTVLCNILSRPNHFFQQNKLTITFNKIIKIIRHSTVYHTKD